MRRTASVVLAVLGVVLFTGPAAGALPAAAGTHTGSFSGTSVYETFVPRCPVIHQEFDGRFQLDRAGAGGGRYEMDVCVDGPENFEWPFAGSFEVVTDRGLVLRGLVVGVFVPNDTSGPVLATLTVAESSGPGSPMTGTVTVTGTSDQAHPDRPEHGSVDWGTFTADLTRQ